MIYKTGIFLAFLIIRNKFSTDMNTIKLLDQIQARTFWISQREGTGFPNRVPVFPTGTLPPCIKSN